MSEHRISVAALSIGPVNVRTGFRASCSCGWSEDIAIGCAPGTGRLHGPDLRQLANQRAMEHRRDAS